MMPIKWKLFAIANYILLFGYIVLLGLVIKAATKMPPDNNEIFEVTLLFLSLLIIVLNSFLNINIFHKNFPARPLTNGLKRIHQVFSVLFILGLGVIFYTLYPNVLVEINPRAYDYPSEGYFLTFIFVLTAILGGFILINQFGIRKYLDHTAKNSVEKMIEEIGA